VIPEPHATLQGIRIPSAILKIVFRHILFLKMQVLALTIGGFRIVSDHTLVIIATFTTNDHRRRRHHHRNYNGKSHDVFSAVQR